MDDMNAARALGWASLAIGATEIAGTRLVERTLGVGDQGPLLLGLGLRECLSGAMILSQDEPTAMLKAGMWSRVVGDAMDLALLAGAAKTTSNPRGLAFAIGNVAAITLLDLYYAQKLQRAEPRGGRTKLAELPEESQGVGEILEPETLEWP